MSAQSSSAGPNPLNEFLEKATCSRCGGRIEKGEDRVVVMAVELKHPEEDEEPEGTPARRGLSTPTMFLCTVCYGEDPMLQLPNPWWKIRQDGADPSAVKHPSDDATLVSVDDVEKTYAEKLYGKKVHGKHVGPQPTEPLPPAEESDLQSRMAGFLASPRSSGMPNELRVVALRWAERQTQMDIAQELGISQATVSRRLEEAKTWLCRR